MNCEWQQRRPQAHELDLRVAGGARRHQVDISADKAAGNIRIEMAETVVRPWPSSSCGGNNCVSELLKWWAL
jgi:hypothetical protein